MNSHLNKCRLMGHHSTCRVTPEKHQLDDQDLFEREMQKRALEEFDDLSRIKEQVDWEAFRPSVNALVKFFALLLGVKYSMSDRILRFMLLTGTLSSSLWGWNAMVKSWFKSPCGNLDPADKIRSDRVVV